MPVKLCYFVRPKATLTTAEFQKKWREVHGPLVASVQTPLKLVKYTQVLREDNDLDKAMKTSRPKLTSDEPQFDVMDEYVFEGTVDDFTGTYNSPEGKAAWQALIQDEEKYVDFAKSILFFTTEHNQLAINPRGEAIASTYNRFHRIVVLCELAENYGLAHWERDHAALVRRWGDVIGFAKYQQNHPRESDTAQILEELRVARGMKPSKYKLFTTFWMSLAVPQDDTMGAAMTEIQADEHSGFIKEKSGIMMTAKELIFVDAYRA